MDGPGAVNLEIQGPRTLTPDFPGNNIAGIDFLIKQISATARRRKIPQKQIFLGGEDEPAYVANFTAALREKGYLVSILKSTD